MHKWCKRRSTTNIWQKDCTRADQSHHWKHWTRDGALSLVQSRPGLHEQQAAFFTVPSPWVRVRGNGSSLEMLLRHVLSLRHVVSLWWQTCGDVCTFCHQRGSDKSCRYCTFFFLFLSLGYQYMWYCVCHVRVCVYVCVCARACVKERERREERVIARARETERDRERQRVWVEESGREREREREKVRAEQRVREGGREREG